MLSTAQKQQYTDNGWLVVENVFDTVEVDALRDFATQMAEDDVKNNADVSSYAVDYAEDGSALPRKIGSPFLRDERFRQFAMQRKLCDILNELLGDEALMATDQIFMKPPRHGTEKPYHQDNFYFNVTPAEAMITAWIALDDVDEENGCLEYISGSHKDGIIEHEPVPGETYNLTPNPDALDLSRAAYARVKKGGVVFHHGVCFHKSGANHSDRWRRAYATHWVTAAAQSASGLLDKAYFKNPDIYLQPV